MTRVEGVVRRVEALWREVRRPTTILHHHRLKRQGCANWSGLFEPLLQPQTYKTRFKTFFFCKHKHMILLGKPFPYLANP